MTIVSRPSARRLPRPSVTSPFLAFAILGLLSGAALGQKPPVAKPVPVPPPTSPARAEAVTPPAPLSEYARRRIPAFKLKLIIDLPVMVSGGLLSLGWVIPKFAPPYCLPNCEKKDVFVLDRPTAGFFDKKWALASDIGLYSMLGGGVFTLLIEGGFRRHAWNDLVVLLQSVLISNSITILTAMAARRPRPLVYGTKASLSTRTSGSATQSFFSGHVGASFAVTLSLWSALRRRRPDSPLQWIVLGVGLAVSSFVAVGRVMAGKHFLTDVLIGAAVGTTSGLVVPTLHGNPAAKRLQATLVPGGAGLAFTWD